jgi:subtilase family protein
LLQMTMIEDKFNSLLESGTLNLGQTIGPEEFLSDGGSKQFYEFGAIYFHPRVGAAFESHGLILQTYISLGENQSGLGYPTSDESDDPNVLLGRMNTYEGGSLNFDPETGVTENYFDLPIAPQVVVKIVDSLPLGIDRGVTLSLDDLAGLVGLTGDPLVEAVRFLFPDLVLTRLFEDLTSAEIGDLIATAVANDPAYVPPVFDNYLVISCPDDFDTDGLAAAFNLWTGVVEFAYTQPPPSDPVVVGTANPFFVGQGHLGAFGQGIAVQAAWAKGADGSERRFVDLERGWFFGHEDLPKPIPLLAGINRRQSFHHGCAVLGEIVAVDDNRGVVGIAPNAIPHAISYFDPKFQTSGPRLNAMIASRILLAARSLRTGDVLMLEVQIAGVVNGATVVVPAEADRGIRDAIRLVVRAGVIVVEAAGNGNADLDNFVDPTTNNHVLNATLGLEFVDSGAIMVGSCTSTTPHAKFLESNFGSRIDCWGWGENILTTGNFNNPTQVNAYFIDPPFGGTSGATPMIAGICLLIQNLQFLLQPRPGEPQGTLQQSMRAILRNPSNGNQVTGSTRTIPDMGKLIENQYLS